MDSVLSACYEAHDLVARQDVYVGQRIETSGVVREFHEAGATYYVLEDAVANRVELKPAATFARQRRGGIDRDWAL